MEALRERFGKYHVLEKIAQGGMAEVYKVKTVGIAGFEKIQALKRILPHSAREGRFIRSFIDEARIAVELAHRNIVQVFDFGKADGELFLAMELIEGRDLRTAAAQATARDTPMPLQVAAHIIAEVAAGLDYAHRKTDVYGTALHIVHCDVSPSNVMLSSDGYVKILDFGIARASFAAALERRRLRGKPRYMAPEQTLGEPATAASDVFALGIIAWELITGMPLYRGGDLKAILEAVRRTTPPRVDKLDPEVPKEIADAVATALSREQPARGTAADLGAAFARTALAGGGARSLAAWLAELDSRKSGMDLALSRDSTSMSVPPMPPAPPRAADGGGAPPASGSMTRGDPPMRPSARSLTASIVQSTPDGPLGDGTPGFRERATTTAASAYHAQTPPAGAPAPRFGDRDPTQSVSATALRWAGDATASTTSTAVATGVWGPDGTVAGVARLAEALPGFTRAQTPLPVAPDAAPTEVEPRAYEQLVVPPGANPFAMRFDDDEQTQLGLSIPALPSAASASAIDLVVEADAPPLAEPLVDEPIDDELGAAEPAAVAERRRAVVVAALLDGAPADVLKPIARALGELAYQRGGVVLELDRDALAIAFGLEVAGEDDVAIAMGWALDAAALVRDAAHDGEGAPRLRVGARTGVATSAAVGGGAPSTAGSMTRGKMPAEAIDEARALAREASADRPMFVGAAGRVTSGLYELREVAAPRRIARRSKAMEVVGPRGHDERERDQLERRGKFIGRTAQLAELDAWFQRTIAADRRLTALVIGPAGTGKSRLVAEWIARRQAASAQLRVVMTGASLASRHAPFSLVIDLYKAALGVPPGRGRSARAQVVQRLLHQLHEAAMPEERARAIATDLDRAMELRDGAAIGTPETADLRPRISAGLAAFRAALSDRGHPQLTVVEDMHLADGPSLEVLRHALAVPARGPELLLLTARPDGPAPPAVDLVLTVGDLVGAELRALISDRLGDAATPLNIAAVIARGGGNPLFVEELAQAVHEAGPAPDDVPATARDVVLARVDRLTPRAKATLRYAAVLGGTLRTRLIEELVGDDAPPRVTDSSGDVHASLDDSGASSAVDEALEAGILARAPAGSEDELVFARGLVREVVYEAMPLRAQRDAHARVGRLLASRFFAGRDEPPAVIADHLERGGEAAGAAAFWLRAGRLALAAFDADAAIAHFTRTLTLERAIEAAAGDKPPTGPSRTRRREALAGREEARRLQGDLTSDAGDLDELQVLCEGSPRRLADVSIRRAQRLLRLGDFQGASVATVVAEDYAISAGDLRLHGEALRVHGEILERVGRFDEALAVVATAAELFAREGAVSEEMQAMIGRGRIHLMRAHYEAARDAYKPVLARIDQTGDPWLERVATNHVAIIEMCLGNYEVAMASAQRSLELCRRYGDRAREGEAQSVAGIILLEVGLYDRAAAQFAEALELLSRTGSRWSRADCLIYAGACDLRRGRAAGMAMLDEALGEARRLGARYLEANALITRAGARLRASEPAAAADDAAAGAAVAHGATLVGYEIQGLVRQALGMVRDPRGGRIGEAAGLVHRALAMLDQQRYLEGSEEEVYAACVEVLHAAAASDRAHLVRARGRAEVERKLAALTDPAWREAYAAIPECRALRGYAARAYPLAIQPPASTRSRS
ncbi:MAG TPA: protein kinase [Kofleriaceae bacterium]|nr:protein kinase [Kofleriaceae bacterium]